MKKILIIMVSALMLGLVACQKEENNDKKDGAVTPAPTKQEILASKTWLLTAMTIDPPMMGKTDIYAMLDPCEKDNTWKFSNDKPETLVIDEGSNMCSGSMPKKTTTWSLDAAGTKLTIDKYDYALKDLSSDGFKISEVWADQGKNYTITSTYGPK